MRLSTLRMSALVVALVGALLASGCSLLSPWGDTRSVSDPSNVFHFKVPAKWHADTDAGFIFVYAEGGLPEDPEKPEALSLLVFSSTEASSATVPEMLDYLIDARAKSKSWTNVEKGEVVATEVGGRPGSYVEVSAKTAGGVAFDSRYYFVRTGTYEAFMAAIAPYGKKIGAFDDDLQKVTTQWFWHSDETSASPSAETSGS